MADNKVKKAAKDLLQPWDIRGDPKPRMRLQKLKNATEARTELRRRGGLTPQQMAARKMK
jgi:hypothetical protein